MVPTGSAGLRTEFKNVTNFFAYWGARRASRGAGKVEPLRDAVHDVTTTLETPTRKKTVLTRKQFDALKKGFAKLKSLDTKELDLPDAIDRDLLATIQDARDVHELLVFLMWAKHNSYVPETLTDGYIKRIKDIMGAENTHIRAMEKYVETLQKEAYALEHEHPFLPINPIVQEAHLLTGSAVTGLTARRAQRGIRSAKKVHSKQQIVRREITEHLLETAFKHLEQLVGKLQDATTKLDKGEKLEMIAWIEVMFRLNQAAESIINYEKAVGKNLKQLNKELSEELHEITVWANTHYQKARRIGKDVFAAISEVEGALKAA